MEKELYEQKNFNNEFYRFLISRFIREYDMKKSNISILFEKGIIDSCKYQELYCAPKLFREKYIGKMILRNPEIQRVLDCGVIEAKERLFKANNIKEEEVLTIKNDAVFIIGRPLYYTDFGNYQFSNKNIYTSFYSLGKKGKKELYYFYDKVSEKEILDVKGINDNKLSLHYNYMIEFLKILFCTAETETLYDCIELLESFKDKYLRLELEPEYYRKFDADSLYELQPVKFLGKFMVPYVSESELKALDISHNLGIIRELEMIYSDLYLTLNKM